MRHFFSRHFHALKTTENHWLRKTIGVLLVIGGMLGFLPVLGYWMLPLGLALLAVDWLWARRLSRRLIVWWGRRVQRWQRWRLRWRRGGARGRKNRDNHDTRSGPSPR
jgi:purine-cytosine permease-like protein